MNKLIALDERPQRSHAEPWYSAPDLVGDTQYDTPDGKPLAADEEHLLDYFWEELCEDFSGKPVYTGFAVARVLPQDTYLPADHVHAVLTAALWWGKPVDVSWMEMEFDPLEGSEVPMQKHRRDAAVMYIEDDAAHFGVATPEDVNKPARIQADCVTNIRVALNLPDPETPAQMAERKARTPAEQLPAGLQVDG